MSEPPEHAACRQRTDEEHRALWAADTEEIGRLQEGEFHDRIAVEEDDLSQLRRHRS